MIDHTLLIEIIIYLILIVTILINIFLFYKDRKDRIKTEQTMKIMFNYISKKN